MPTEPRGALLLLHRAVPPVPTHVGRHVRHDVLAQIRSISASASWSVSSAASAQVHLELAPLGDHVRPRAPVDDADVHGDARPAAVEPLQRDDRMRRLEHRVPTLLGLDAGVRRPAGDRDPVVRDPLARRHDVAVLPRALQHERRVVLRRQLADHGAGVRRADLLVGVADVRDRAEPVEARPPGATSVATNPVSSPPFMSETPGPTRDVSVDAERPLGDGSLVEHRVHVADEQHVGPARATAGVRSRGLPAATDRRRPAGADGARPPNRSRGTAPRTGRRSRSPLPACTSRSRRSPSPPATRRSRRSDGRRCRVGSQRPRGAV